jgi:thiosulfate/3-mercaptopyruvate sulfurtransferase
MVAGPNVLVDPAWIAAHLDDPLVRLIEVDVSRAAYDAGHIPGAVLWNAYVDLRSPDYSPIDQNGLATLLSEAGVTPETTVVFYGYGQYLGFWLLKRQGHDRVLVMDGSRERWEAAGETWSTDAVTPIPSDYPRPAEGAGIGPSRQAVHAMSNDQGTVVLDVRSHAEFEGERFWPSGATEGAGRPGHIPGAAHVPVDVLRDEDGDFANVEELRALYDAAGAGADKRIVTYCTIGNRASQVWFVLEYLLGYQDVDVYYGSWAEWGSRTDTPVAT